MASIRQKQVGELIRRTFSTILMQEGRFIYGSEALVTVTNVMVSPDMGQAKIYLSIYNTDDKANIILEMEENSSRLRHSLGNALGKTLRRIPSLEFFLDDTVDEMYRVERLLDEYVANQKKDKDA